ncbi:MAG: hypothetical protein PWQ97_1381 [Tepidanaerobacteraceae bacterium]|nr:hypothetical protein [Tepidanaerobacteraceae bacterium]
MGTIKILEFVRDAEGGMKKHVEAILTGLDKNVFDVILACPKGQFDKNIFKNKVRNIYEISVGDKRNPLSMFVSLLNLIQIIKKEKIDIIHCHGILCCILGTFASILSGHGLTVTTLHNFPAARKTALKQHLCIFLAGFCIKFNRRIIAVSSNLKHHVSKLWRISEDKIQVIYNGIDVKEISSSLKESEYTSNELQYPIMHGLLSGTEKTDYAKNCRSALKQIIILNISRLIFSKGVDVFLKASALLLQVTASKGYEPGQTSSNPFFLPLFLIAGDGPEKPKLKKIAHQLGIEKNLKFLPFRRDIYKLIDRSDMVVLSSRSEGLGISILEALALSKPVIASNVGGIPEIVAHGSTGLLVPPDDPEALARAMLYFINHPTEAKLMAEKGRQMVYEKFTSEKMINNLQQLFLSIKDIHS